MKNFYRFLMAAAVLFSAASCAKEDISSSIAGEETIEVFFATNLADLGTRAYDDGTNVTTLRYFVYDTAGNYLSELSKTCNNREADGHFRFSLNLVKSMTYNIYFWADNGQDSPYEVVMNDNNIPTGVIEANYNGVAANDGSLDAFYGSVNITPENQGTTQNVKLTRPFAQLNVLTSDWDDIHNSGVESPADITSSVTIEGAYTQFSFLVGKAVESSQQTITFDHAVIPAGKTEPESLKDDYTYLAMSYLFALDKCVANVTYSFKADRTAGEDIVVTTPKYTSVPLKPNYRTNILGALFTNPTKFDVELSTGYNTEMMDIKVFNYMDLQAALDAVNANETTTIYLGADIVGNVTDIQKPGRKVTIDGNGHKYNGTIKVHSNSYYYADAALTIKNVNFETSSTNLDKDGDPYFNFIEALENGSERYSSNITVEDCTFTALETRSAVNIAVGLQVKATRGVTVKGCTATNMHSLIQAQSCDTGDVKVVNCTVNGKNGVAFKQVKAATVEGTTITALEYGIRFDGNTDNYGIVVKDNNVTAVQPLIVRKMTGKDNTIALKGTNTLTTEEDYQIVITNGSDDAEYVKPTGTYTLTGADNYTVYPRDYYFPVATWDELTAAIADNEPKVMLTQNITISESRTITNSVVINLNGKAFEINNANAMLNIGDTKNSSKPNITIKSGNFNGMIYALSGEVTIKDVVFGGTIAYISASQGVISTKHASLLMENCKMTNVKKSGATKPRSLSTEARSSGYLILRDCNFKNSNLDRPYINPLNGNTTLELTNCALYGGASNIDLGASYSWTNMNLTGCSGGFTFTISRASTSLTDEEMAVYKAIKKNNSGSMRFIFSDGEKNNL